MAYTTLNVLKSNGLFKSYSQNFAPITAGKLEFDISDTKDPIALFIDIPNGATGTFTLTFEKNNKSVSLAAEKLNVIHITSKNLVNADGKIRFTLLTSNSSGITNLNIKAAAVSYTAVINH